MSSIISDKKKVAVPRWWNENTRQEFEWWEKLYNSKGCILMFHSIYDKVTFGNLVKDENVPGLFLGLASASFFQLHNTLYGCHPLSDEILRNSEVDIHRFDWLHCGRSSVSCDCSLYPKHVDVCLFIMGRIRYTTICRHVCDIISSH